MPTPNLELPTLILGIGKHAEAAIVEAFAKLDAEITALKERVDELEVPVG